MSLISPDIFFFQLNTRKDLVKSLAVIHLRLNLLRNTKTTLLTTQRYNNHPRPLPWTLIMDSSLRWTPTGKRHLVMVPISTCTWTSTALLRDCILIRQFLTNLPKMKSAIYNCPIIFFYNTSEKSGILATIMNYMAFAHCRNVRALGECLTLIRLKI